MSVNETRRGRKTLARHGQQKAPGVLRQGLALLAVAASVLFVSTAGVVAYAAVDFRSIVEENQVVLEGQESTPPDIGALDNEGINIVFAGLDACEEDYVELFGDRCANGGNEDSRAGVLNDVNLMVHISPEPRRVTVVSFPRDMMVAAPECVDEDGVVAYAQTRSQLNTAYARGGLGCVAKTISEVSGQQVDYGATVTWGGVIEITNALGGVDVCVAGDGIYDRHTGLALDPGVHTLAGLEALQFLRTRYGVADGSDLGRIGNQQVYMSALARKLVSDEVLTNPGILLTLARTSLENVNPTSSLTNPMTLVQMAMATSDVPLSEWVFVQYPVIDDAYDVNRVAPNQIAAEQIWAALDANAPLDLAGGVGSGAIDEGAEEEAVEPEPEVTETADPTAAPDPGALDDSISGTNAENVTCSNGAG